MLCTPPSGESAESCAESSLALDSTLSNDSLFSPRYEMRGNLRSKMEGEEKKKKKKNIAGMQASSRMGLVSGHW